MSNNTINNSFLSVLVKNEEEKLQKIAVLKANGMTDELIANINWKFPKIRIIDKFVYDEVQMPHCSMCNSEVDVQAYNEEELVEMKKLGLCSACYAEYKKLQDLKVKFANIKKPRKGASDGNKRQAGELIRTAFYNNADLLTEEQLTKLCDFEFCKKELKLGYAFLLDVTNCISDTEIQDAVKDIKGRARWSTKSKYSAYGKTYCLTSQLYDDKRHQIENFEALMEKWTENPNEAVDETTDNTENNDGNIDINTMEFIEPDAE